jgi:hypothetical protein
VNEEKRDYRKDLAVCEAAISGHLMVSQRPMLEQENNWAVSKMVNGFVARDIAVEMLECDAVFYILARTALPRYIRKVMELENRNKQLREKYDKAILDRYEETKKAARFHVEKKDLEAQAGVMREALDIAKEWCPECHGYGYIDEEPCETCEKVRDAYLSTPSPANEIVQIHLYECGHVWQKKDNAVPEACPVCSLEAREARYRKTLETLSKLNSLATCFREMIVDVLLTTPIPIQRKVMDDTQKVPSEGCEVWPVCEPDCHGIGPSCPINRKAALDGGKDDA